MFLSSLFISSRAMENVSRNCNLCLILIFCLFTVIKAIASEPETGCVSSQLLTEPPPQGSVDNDDEYLPARSALNALDDLMTYVSDGADQLNLDGLVGLTIVTGQLRVLLSRVRTIPADLKADIQNAIAFSTKIIAKATPLIAASEPAYYEELKSVLDETFFEHNYDLRATNASLIYPTVNDVDHERLNETFSDHCLSQLQGTGTLDGQPCSIPDDCWNYMMAPKRTGYRLTHQIIYLLFGESMHCGQQFANATQKFCKLHGRCQIVPELQEVMCANVVQQMKNLEADDFHVQLQDLYMEQVAICGILGFKEVCTKPRLNRILSWQNPSGCYRLQHVRSRQRRRYKRYDALFTDGCSAHKTSVAAGALGICVRIHVEDPTSN